MQMQRVIEGVAVGVARVYKHLIRSSKMSLYLVSESFHTPQITEVINRV